MKVRALVSLFTAAAVVCVTPQMVTADTPKNQQQQQRKKPPVVLPQINASSRDLEQVVVDCLRRKLGPSTNAKVMESGGYKAAFGEKTVFWAFAAGKWEVGGRSFYYQIADLEGRGLPALSVRVANAQDGFDWLRDVTRIDVARDNGASVLSTSYEEGILESVPNYGNSPTRSNDSKLREMAAKQISEAVGSCSLFPRFGGVRQALFQISGSDVSPR